MYTKNFRVVQLMYRPLLGFLQSVPKLVVGVQTCRFDHYTSCGVGIVHDKFQGCTVDVQAATEFSTISTLPCNLRLDHYTSCSVGIVHDKFHDCRVVVQATTEFLTISTLPRCRCTNLLLGPFHFMRCT